MENVISELSLITIDYFKEYVSLMYALLYYFRNHRWNLSHFQINPRNVLLVSYILQIALTSQSLKAFVLKKIRNLKVDLRFYMNSHEENSMLVSLYLTSWGATLVQVWGELAFFTLYQMKIVPHFYGHMISD